MRKLIVVLAVVCVAAGFYCSAQAEPSGPHAQIIGTLQEINDKLDGLVAHSGTGVPKTGQTGCWDAFGMSIPCAGTGQDGEYQAGVPVIPPRFTDNVNNTVTDNLTGLIWLKNPDCLGSGSWTTALSIANTLSDGPCGLSDLSSPGDWRLPNIRELLSLLDYGQHVPALPPGHPFSIVQGVNNWSSSTMHTNGSFAWAVGIGDGHVVNFLKTNEGYIWPVRGGL